MGFKNIEQKSGESFDHYYHRLAKVADRRLRELEKRSKEEGFQSATKWAYAKAQKDISKYGTSNRFDTKAPSDMRVMKAKVNDVKEFLQSATSTKTDIIKVYKQKAETTNKKFGTSYTWESMAKLYLSKSSKQLEKYKASKTTQRAIGKFQDSGRKNFSEYRKTIKAMKKDGMSDSDIQNDIYNALTGGQTSDEFNRLSTMDRFEFVDDDNVAAVMSKMLMDNKLYMKDLF